MTLGAYGDPQTYRWFPLMAQALVNGQTELGLWGYSVPTTSDDPLEAKR